jgi:hypothetical protein
MNGQLNSPAALSPWKDTSYPLVKELDGFQRQSGRCGEENSLLRLPGIEPLSPST